MKLYNLINQQFLGSHIGYDAHFRDDKFYYQIYKNPKNIKRLSNGVRGIIDDNGDVFIVQQIDEHGNNVDGPKTGLIHFDIIKILNKHELFTKYINLKYGAMYYSNIRTSSPFKLNHVCIQIINGIVKLGENYVNKTIKKFKSQYEQFFDKTSLKNPNLKFQQLDNRINK